MSTQLETPFKIIDTLKTHKSGKEHLVYKIAYNNKLYCLKKTNFCENEYLILKSLHHPRIPKATKVDGNVLIEWIEGNPLSDLKPTPEEYRDYIRQLLEILDYVHSKQIMHLDIKPDNIIVNQYGQVFLIDWEYSSNIHTSFKKVYGTPYYIAPEVWDKKRYTTKADIWALGIMIFEQSIGKTPFEGVRDVSELVEFLFTKDFDYDAITDLKTKELVQKLLTHFSDRPKVPDLFNERYFA